MRHTSVKDIEISCCKKHQRPCWSISALIASANKKNIGIPFNDYQSFFNYLVNNCSKEDRIHVSWDCTPYPKTICIDMQTNWEGIN